MMKLTTLILALTASAAMAAAPHDAPRRAVPPPNLQGVWISGSITHLQRPKEFTALVATPDEAAAYERKARERYEKGVAPTKPDAPAPEPGVVADESAQWVDAPVGLARVRGEIRTSWIVEPKDGRLPFTPASRAASDQALKNEEVFDDPESRPFDERCLLGGGGGVAAPMINADLTRIVQTRDAVVIYGEQNHEARIVPIGAQRGSVRRLPAAMAPWMGDSVAWWEGKVLVVETLNFNARDRWRWTGGVWIPISAAAKVTERFEKIGAGELLYSFTVEDPANYSGVWKGEIPLHGSTKPMFEFACHEGNYALANILRGGRIDDQAKAAAAPGP